MKTLHLDKVNKKISLGSKFIHVTEREFDVLAFLVQHDGKIVSRRDIFDQVWGKDFAIFSNVIDVHIKNIRCKLKSKYAPKIETIRSLGYRLHS